MHGTQTLDTVRFRYDLKVCRVWARLEAWSWFGRRARAELSAVLFENVIFEAPWRELTGGCEYFLLESGDFGQGLEVCRVWVQSVSERALADGQPRSLDLPAWVG